MSKKQKCILKLERLERRGCSERNVEHCLEYLLPLVESSEKLRGQAGRIEELVRARDPKGAIQLVRGKHFYLKRGILIAMGVGALVAAPFVFSALGMGSESKSPYRTQVQRFAKDLGQGRIRQAYDRMTPQYRKQVGLEAFQKAVLASPMLRTTKRAEVTSTSKGDDTAEVKGHWHSDGKKVWFNLLLINVKDTWFIQDVMIGKKAPLPTAKE